MRNVHTNASPLKRMASFLPSGIQQRMRSWKLNVDFELRRFRSNEPEFQLLPEWLSPGDWILDVGANVGHYTMRMSDLVGPSGRVIAFEPILETAEILTRIAAKAKHRNITILNVGLSEHTSIQSFHVPKSETGLPNYFEAQIACNGEQKALCIAIDDLSFPERIALVKVDVDGHEAEILNGMRRLILRDHPILIMEANELIYRGFLAQHGYKMNARLPKSPNLVFTPERFVCSGARQ